VGVFAIANPGSSPREGHRRETRLKAWQYLGLVQHDRKEVFLFGQWVPKGEFSFSVF
jgi:hypothetical protein